MDDYDLPYSETVNFRGDRGAFLAPDECRICWFEQNKLTTDCHEHNDSSPQIWG